MSDRQLCVFMMKRNGEPYRWIVRVTVQKERRYVGCYKTKPEAVSALQAFMAKHGKPQSKKLN
jgi:hypothetical protein